jgi:hypothetical protein
MINVGAVLPFSAKKLLSFNLFFYFLHYFNCSMWSIYNLITAEFAIAANISAKQFKTIAAPFRTEKADKMFFCCFFACVCQCLVAVRTPHTCESLRQVLRRRGWGWGWPFSLFSGLSAFFWPLRESSTSLKQKKASATYLQKIDILEGAFKVSSSGFFVNFVCGRLCQVRIVLLFLWNLYKIEVYITWCT